MKSFSEFLEDLLEDLDEAVIHPVGSIVKVNNPKHWAHGKEGTVLGHEGMGFHTIDIPNEEHVTIAAKHLTEEALNERKIIIRFRNGQRKRKLVCGKGMRAVGQRCIRQSGPERMHRRLGNLKRKRSLRKKGSGWKRRANFKRQRSLRKRKASLGHR